MDSADTRRYGGYGVGLFLCQKLLELLGGSIRAESDGKTGSVFHVVFPGIDIEKEEKRERGKEREGERETERQRETEIERKNENENQNENETR